MQDRKIAVTQQASFGCQLRVGKYRLAAIGAEVCARRRRERVRSDDEEKTG
jgi:hypothetical protein